MKKLLLFIAASVLTATVATAQTPAPDNGTDPGDQPPTGSSPNTPTEPGSPGTDPGTGSNPGAGSNHGWRNGPCGKVNLTDAEKSQIKDANFQFQQTKINLEAQLKTARLNYRKLVADPKADINSAQTAAQAVATAVGQLSAAKLAFRTQVLFQILAPEQRGPALQCQMQKDKRRHSGEGRRRQGVRHRPSSSNQDSQNM